MKQKLSGLVALLFAFCMQTTALAQEKKDKKVEKKEVAARMTPAQRINRQTTYVARELMLDDATTAKFAPLYQKYLGDLEACQKHCREAYGPKNKDQKTQLTDAQIEKRIEGRFAQAHQILNIREKYYREFKKFLNPRQIQKMYKAEKSIQKRVRKEVERRKNSLKQDRRKK